MEFSTVQYRFVLQSCWGCQFFLDTV